MQTNYNVRGIERAIVNAIIQALDDNEGVSFETYERFLEVGDHLNTVHLVLEQVQHTDGRYYLPEDVVQGIRIDLGLAHPVR